MISLTDKQQELFDHIDSILPGSGHMAYDFRDQKQLDFAKMMIELSGQDQKYPGMVKSLDLAQKHHTKNNGPEPLADATDGWQNMFKIPGLNLTQNGTLASNGLGTVVGGYANMNLSLMVQSRQSKNIVAHGFNHNFTQELLTVTTVPSTSTEIDVDAYLHYHGTSASGSPIAGLVKRVDKDSVTADPSLDAPCRTTNNPNNPNAINIGLGRPWTDQGGDSQFDYAWNEPMPQPGQHPVGKIPFVGSVTFSSPISAPLEFNTNFLLNIYVADQTNGGGATLTPADYDKVARAFSIDTNDNKTLKWNLPAGQSTSDPGNPIVFSNVPWSSDTLAYFFCEMDVVLANGNFASAFVQSSSTPDQDPLDGTKYILPIDFIWHCLADDSWVIMADGSKKIIKEVVAGDKVKVNDQGDYAVVQWTNLGAHHGPAWIIETDSGQKITASENHIFYTENEAKPAADVKVGDKLKSYQGLTTVTTVMHRDFDGLMCNLATVPLQDANDEHAKDGVFFANNFLVGDINAQKRIKAMCLKDINWVKNRVPEFLHSDVDTFFANRS